MSGVYDAEKITETRSVIAAVSVRAPADGLGEHLEMNEHSLKVGGFRMTLGAVLDEYLQVWMP